MIHSARRSVWLGRVALPGQPGGLGVPSSNLGAPTRLSPNYQCFSQVAGAALVCKMRTEGRQSAPTRTNSPEKVPNSVLQAFRRDSNGREKLFSCAPAPDKDAPETSPSKLSPEPGVALPARGSFACQCHEHTKISRIAAGSQ